MQSRIKELKELQKALALEIKSLKSKRKELKGYVPQLDSTRYSYRRNHITYCLLRGRTMEQIEPKLREPDNYTNVRVRKDALAMVEDIKNPKSVEAQNGKESIRTSGQEPVAIATGSSIWSRVTRLLA